MTREEVDMTSAIWWTWWTPPPWRRAWVVSTLDGEIVDVGPWIPGDLVLCDLCSEPVDVRPVPVLWNTHAACKACFHRMTGVDVRQAAARDGVSLT
jgi:hypothetical protein